MKRRPPPPLSPQPDGVRAQSCWNSVSAGDGTLPSHSGSQPSRFRTLPPWMWCCCLSVGPWPQTCGGSLPLTALPPGSHYNPFVGQHHIGYRDLMILALAPLIARHDFLLLHITATLQLSSLSLRCHMLSFHCLAEQPCDIQLQLGECCESDAVVLHLFVIAHSDATNSRTPPLAELSYVPPRGAADAGPRRVGVLGRFRGHFESRISQSGGDVNMPSLTVSPSLSVSCLEWTTPKDICMQY